MSSEGSILTPEAGEYPGYPLRVGSTGESVEQLQVWLRAAGQFYESIPVISAVDGIFGTATENAVKAFQRTFNLTADGIVGPMTWRQLQSVYDNLEKEINAGASGPPVYPQERCRFAGCLHVGELGCAVAKAVEDGELPPSRYRSNRALYEEVKDLKEWQVRPSKRD